MGMENKQVDPRTSTDINSALLISVLDAICQAFSEEQKTTVANRLHDRADHLARTATDERALAAAGLLTSFALVASGKVGASADSLEEMMRNLMRGKDAGPSR